MTQQCSNLFYPSTLACVSLFRPIAQILSSPAQARRAKSTVSTASWSLVITSEFEMTMKHLRNHQMTLLFSMREHARFHTNSQITEIKYLSDRPRICVRMYAHNWVSVMLFQAYWIHFLLQPKH